MIEVSLTLLVGMVALLSMLSTPVPAKPLITAGGLWQYMPSVEDQRVVDGDTYVLDIGCGVGITPCHMAKAYGCRVVGVDLREAMVIRAWQRARREGVGDLVEFRVPEADLESLFLRVTKGDLQ